MSHPVPPHPPARATAEASRRDWIKGLGGLGVASALGLQAAPTLSATP